MAEFTNAYGRLREGKTTTTSAKVHPFTLQSMSCCLKSEWIGRSGGLFQFMTSAIELFLDHSLRHARTGEHIFCIRQVDLLMKRGDIKTYMGFHVNLDFI